MEHDHDDDHPDNALDPMTARVRALETILTEKGLVDPAAIDAIVETYENEDRPAQWRPVSSPRPGAIRTLPTG